MIQAVGAISQYSDPEYIRIIMELRKLGITPSGNKSIDRQKLVDEKRRLEEKFEVKEEKPAPNIEREKMEEERTGATALAEINRILLGI